MTSHVALFIYLKMEKTKQINKYGHSRIYFTKSMNESSYVREVSTHQKFNFMSGQANCRLSFPFVFILKKTFLN